MSRRRKVILVALLCAVALIAGIEIGWILRGPPRGMNQLLDILTEMEAKPSTDADWKAVTVEKTTADISGTRTQVVAVRNVRAVLEADGTTSAQHVLVSNTRSEDALRTLLWSPKANNALDVDWPSGTVQRATRPTQAGEYFLHPENVPSRVKYNANYRICTPGGTTQLLIRTPSATRRLPWDRPSFLGETYFFESYRYGVALERDNTSRKMEAMVVIDLRKLDVAGIIPLPPQVGRYPPLLLIEPAKDLLLCFDLDVAWIVCVDLRPARLAAEAAEKQAPPPEKKDP